MKWEFLVAFAKRERYIKYAGMKPFPILPDSFSCPCRPWAGGGYSGFSGESAE